MTLNGSLRVIVQDLILNGFGRKGERPRAHSLATNKASQVVKYLLFLSHLPDTSSGEAIRPVYRLASWSIPSNQLIQQDR